MVRRPNSTINDNKSHSRVHGLYGLESVSPSKSQLRSLNNCINTAVFKVFGVNDAVCVNDLRCFVGLHDVEEL